MELQQLEHKMWRKRNSIESSSSDEYSSNDDQEKDTLDESANSESKQIALQAEQREKLNKLDQFNQIVKHEERRKRTTDNGKAL
jgi:hypothetical protein